MRRDKCRSKKQGFDNEPAAEQPGLVSEYRSGAHDEIQHCKEKY